jgi:hypothetical protein
MEPEFITYQKFNDLALANELAALLEQHNINYLVDEDSLTFNPSFALNDELSKNYAVKINANDFEQVNELLKQQASENIGEVEKDYYLFSFTDDELKDVVVKADEWNAFDVQLARKLLSERGKAVSDSEIADLEEKRIEALKEPEPSQLTWVILGYIIAIASLVMPFFISIIGLFIGWHLSSYKKTLPNGERVYAYNEADRKHGKRIFYIGIIVFLFGLIWFFINNVSTKNY